LLLDATSYADVFQLAPRDRLRLLVAVLETQRLPDLSALKVTLADAPCERQHVTVARTRLFDLSLDDLGHVLAGRNQIEVRALFLTRVKEETFSHAIFLSL
jgi:hypothetical protein